jgi:hypothetical protein
LLKYQPFYAFLLRHAPKVAKQVERGYVTAARSYYETALRRYTRSLGVIKGRTVEKTELIGSGTSDIGASGYKEVYERLKYAELDVDDEGGAILAYMADEKEYVSDGFRLSSVQTVMTDLFRASLLKRSFDQSI